MTGDCVTIMLKHEEEKEQGRNNTGADTGRGWDKKSAKTPKNNFCTVLIRAWSSPH